MDTQEGPNHRRRKELFARGLRQGHLTVDDIEQAIPPGSMTSSERWLLYFSLRAAQVEIRGEPPADAGRSDAEGAPPQG